MYMAVLLSLKSLRKSIRSTVLYKLIQLLLKMKHTDLLLLLELSNLAIFLSAITLSTYEKKLFGWLKFALKAVKALEFI